LARIQFRPRGHNYVNRYMYFILTYDGRRKYILLFSSRLLEDKSDRDNGWVPRWFCRRENKKERTWYRTMSVTLICKRWT
jgi:hypothetical protein